MFNYIMVMGLLNMIGGRDFLGPNVSGEKWGWRWILPAIASASLAADFQLSMWNIAWVFVSVIAYWPGNHSFEEIHGNPDPTKYGRFVKWIGYKLYPDNGSKARNRLRGALMKGLDAYNEYPTFVLLGALTPFAPIIGAGLLLKGYIYYLVGRTIPEQWTVLTSEFFYWAWKGALILSIIYSVSQ